MTELWSTTEVIRRLGGRGIAHERVIRHLLSRDGAPCPIVIAGLKRYKRAEIEAWVERMPSVMVTKE